MVALGNASLTPQGVLGRYQRLPGKLCACAQRLCLLSSDRLLPPRRVFLAPVEKVCGELNTSQATEFLEVLRPRAVASPQQEHLTPTTRGSLLLAGSFILGSVFI